MRTSSFTILLIALLLIIIVLAFIVIIGLAIMINTGSAPSDESGAVYQFIQWSQFILNEIISTIQGILEYIAYQIEQLSKSL